MLRYMRGLEAKDLSLTAAMIPLGSCTMKLNACLLYTSDAADERSSVDLGGRRLIKKKKTEYSGDGHVKREERSSRSTQHRGNEKGEAEKMT